MREFGLGLIFLGAIMLLTSVAMTVRHVRSTTPNLLRRSTGRHKRPSAVREAVRLISLPERVRVEREAKRSFLERLTPHGLTVTDEAKNRWWPYASTAGQDSEKAALRD